MSKKEMREMRKRFCILYAALGDAEEAAVRAGAERAEALGFAACCLKSRVCRRHIARLRELSDDSGTVISGLRRLAFGSSSDAVRLVFAEEFPPPSELEGLDLFGVSEIKRDKGGGVEVRFFDRMKALEKLYELEKAQEDSKRADGLIEALTASVKENELGDK